MRSTRIYGSGCLCCAMVLVLCLAGGTAQGTVIQTQLDGSIAVSAMSATQNAASLDLSTLFTPTTITSFAPTFGTGLTMVGNGGGGIGDFETLPFTFITAGGLDTSTQATAEAWTFSSTNGDWATSTFTTVSSSANYIDFLLTGIFTPKGALLATTNADPTLAELRISLNQSGGTVNWTSTMMMTSDPIPEPATLSLLAIGGLALLRKRRKQ